jgi:hypothetical protein
MKKLIGFLKFLGGAFLVLLVLSLIANPDGNVGDKAANQGEQLGQQIRAGITGQTIAPRPTATPLPWLEDDFATIRAKSETMTDAQWDAYAKTLSQHIATWTGWVEEVKPNGEIRVDMDPPGDALSVQDCYISVPKADALKYSLDQQIHWTGTVKRASRFLSAVQITFEDCTVLP